MVTRGVGNDILWWSLCLHPRVLRTSAGSYWRVPHSDRIFGYRGDRSGASVVVPERDGGTVRRPLVRNGLLAAIAGAWRRDPQAHSPAESRNCIRRIRGVPGYSVRDNRPYNRPTCRPYRIRIGLPRRGSGNAGRNRVCSFRACEFEDADVRLVWGCIAGEEGCVKPTIVNTSDLAAVSPYMCDVVLAEGLKAVCLIPLVNRGRAIGFLMIGRTSEASFTSEDIEFLSQAAGQIAIAIANALTFEEVCKLRDKLAQEKLYLEEGIRSEMNFENIIGTSPALKRVLELVETVAASDSTVLLLGETGTGKELIARAIHDRSRRKDRTFVRLNCAAIPTGLLESELFGNEKGAFTGAITQKVGRMELADQGTLFLDEVGDIPIEIQPKLLRALQEREFERLGSTHTRRVNIRLGGGTNRDLERMIADKEFRSDLYYRLNVFPIQIPPLRERREDIPLLVSFFVQKFSKQMQKNIESIPPAVMKGLTAWEWPGNIRELENFIERAVILTRSKSLEAPLAELRRSNAQEPAVTMQGSGREDIARIVKETLHILDGNKTAADARAKNQRQEIVRALGESKGRVGGADGAAARMGINRTTLLSRMKKFGIDPGQYA